MYYWLLLRKKKTERKEVADGGMCLIFTAILLIFNRLVRKDFMAHYKTQFYTLKFHCLNQPESNVGRFGA